MLFNNNFDTIKMLLIQYFKKTYIGGFKNENRDTKRD